MHHRFVLLLGVAAACGGSSQPTGLATVTLNGNHALIAYGGHPLPFREYEIPASQLGGHTGCFVQMQSGNLSLSISNGTGRFVEDQIETDSCTGATMAKYSWSGQVTVSGDALQFSNTGADGFVTTDIAHLINGALVFDQRTTPLSYAVDVTN